MKSKKFFMMIKLEIKAFNGTKLKDLIVKNKTASGVSVVSRFK